MFGDKKGPATRSYKPFIEKGIGEDKRTDLTGGGLLRSAGGWEGVKGKYQRIVDARSLLCYWAVSELGLSMASLSRKLELSVSSVSDSVKRGQKISEEKGFNFLKV